MSGSFDGLGRLAQVSMRVHDLGRAEAFYRDVLGMKHLFSVPPKMAFFDCAGTRLYLAVPEKPEFDHPGSVLYFAVADIGAAHAALVARGVVFEEAPHLLAKLPTPTSGWRRSATARATSSRCRARSRARSNYGRGARPRGATKRVLSPPIWLWRRERSPSGSAPQARAPGPPHLLDTGIPARLERNGVMLSGEGRVAS